MNWIADFIQDLRYGLRTLHKSLGFSLAAVLTLALGIGANTALFSLTDALLLRWLPVRDPQELVQLRMIEAQQQPSENFSYSQVRALADQRDILAGVAGYSAASKFNVGPPEDLDRATGCWVNGSFYATLGMQPLVGRLLAPYDDQEGAPPVAVITDAYWERAL